MAAQSPNWRPKQAQEQFDQQMAACRMATQSPKTEAGTRAVRAAQSNRVQHNRQGTPRTKIKRKMKITNQELNGTSGENDNDDDDDNEVYLCTSHAALRFGKLIS